MSGMWWPAPSAACSVAAGAWPAAGAPCPPPAGAADALNSKNIYLSLLPTCDGEVQLSEPFREQPRDDRAHPRERGDERDEARLKRDEDGRGDDRVAEHVARGPHLRRSCGARALEDRLDRRAQPVLVKERERAAQGQPRRHAPRGDEGAHGDGGERRDERVPVDAPPGRARVFALAPRR